MILFVVGAPGVGKTTLVRALLGLEGGDLPEGGYLVPKPKWTVLPSAAAAGHYTGETFDGGDTVPYTGAQDALAYWRAHLAARALTVFDGDRFSNAGVLTWLRDHGHAPRALWLTAPSETLDTRRAARGSHQNAAWMKGRATKAERFAGMLPACALDAGRPLEQLVREARAWMETDHGRDHRDSG